MCFALMKAFRKNFFKSTITKYLKLHKCLGKILLGIYLNQSLCDPDENI